VIALGLRALLPPPPLERATGPWRQRELADREVTVAGFPTAPAQPFARMLAEAGARMRVAGGDGAPFREAGAEFAVPVTSGAGERVDREPGFTPGEQRRRRAAPIDRLVVDATAVTELGALYEQLHPLVPRIRRAGRLVVLARAGARDPVAAAAAAGLEGFVRSAAKELGRRGATAQLIAIEPGAEARAAAIARFLLSPRSAFMTGQALRATTTTVTAAELRWVAALDRKVALVTGAAHGIGEAIARRLAEEGAHVICVDRPAEEVALAAVARAVGGTLVVADLADPGAPRRIAERAPRVDVIVHNAGITRDRTFAKLTAAEWHDVVSVDLDAVVRLTAALLPALRDDGRIICMSSVAGIAGNVGQTAYAAAKAGLIGYARALAGELAPRGITVNAVAPGLIETRMTAAMPLAIREAARRLSALGQGGEPRDVAELVTFLAQPASAGVTGAVLRICGGAFIGA